MRVGISVSCLKCGRDKSPHGRSVPDLRADAYCTEGGGCSGYWDAPLPGCLWPRETEEEFGFNICGNAVKDVGGSDGK